MSVFSQYSWADSIYGVTNNAAVNGLNWSMTGVLPDSSAPNVSLQVNGLTYYYVMSKNPEDAAKVYVRNEDPVNGGYIFEEVDDWTGVPGNSIQKYFRFTPIPSEQWGNGSMEVEGNGTISDPSMIYNYRMDITEPDIICTNSFLNPLCPNFITDLYKYLSTLDTLDPDNEYYEEWLAIQESKKAVVVEVEEIVIEEDDELEESLRTDLSMDGLIDVDQEKGRLDQIANVPLLIPYYNTIYNQGLNEYPDRHIIQDDTQLPDNKRALRQLATDAKHYTMVRSQYDNEQ